MSDETVSVEEERDMWESIARERHDAYEKLKADRNAETVRNAAQLARRAWILMIVLLSFASLYLIATTIRATAKECPTPRILEKP